METTSETTMIFAGCAVALGGHAVLIEGPSGSGKSQLCLMLIDRGGALISDDGVKLRGMESLLIASPAPHIAGKLEVRNLGIVSFPHESSVPVALLVTLSSAAPRFIESAAVRTLLGCTIPRVILTPYETALPVKVELALRLYGRSI